MSQEQQQFESLCRLLTLKRHEQPPPGYFNNFSREVIAQIQAGKQVGADSFFERLKEQLFGGFSLEGKPVLAGACGVMACSVLLAGLVYFEMPEATRSAGGSLVSGPQTDAMTVVANPVPQQPVPLLAVPASDSTGGAAPTLGVTPDSLFGPPTGTIQPASFGN